MKVLVIGSGGREHAWRGACCSAPRVSRVFVAPGNGGTALDTRLVNVPITDFNELAEFVVKEGVALTVVGPEAPLAAGVVDLFRAKGLRIFGPTPAAAQLESSKAFAKAFMKRHGSPPRPTRPSPGCRRGSRLCGTSGCPHRDQGRRPGRGQGRGGRHDPARSP